MATAIGMATIALGFAAVPGWLAVAGVGRWRRGTEGGRLAVVAAALFAPLVLCLIGQSGNLLWFTFGPGNIPTATWWQNAMWLMEIAVPYAVALFPFGLALVALAARAALVAASRRLAEAPAEGIAP